MEEGVYKNYTAVIFKQISIDGGDARDFSNKTARIEFNIIVS